MNVSADSLGGRESGVQKALSAGSFECRESGGQEVWGQTAESNWAAGVQCERGDIGLKRDLEGEMKSEQRELGVVAITDNCVSKKQPV